MSSSVKVLLGILGGAVVVLVLLPVLAGSGLFGSGSMIGQGGMMDQGGGMMGQGGMMDGGWGVLGITGMLIPLLFVVGLVAVIVWAVVQFGSGGHASSGRYASGSAGGVHDHSAEEILKQRFTKGEMNAEEYDERRRILRGESPTAHR